MAFDTGILFPLVKVIMVTGTSWFDMISDLLNGLHFIIGSPFAAQNATININDTNITTTEFALDAPGNRTVMK